MKKGLISLAIVLSMVVSLFAPAIVVSAEEATGPNDIVSPVVIDFANGGRLDADPANVASGDWEYTENSWRFTVQEEGLQDENGGSPYATATIYSPEIVRNHNTNYKAFVVIYKLTIPEGGKSPWIKIHRSGTNRTAFADVTAEVALADGYKMSVKKAPDGGIYMNALNIDIFGSTKELTGGTTLDIAAVAFFATEAEAAAFDLDTWRAEHRNVSIEAPTEAKVGETVTATITADGESFIASSKLTVKYDATRLTYLSVDGLAEGEAVNDEANGVIEIFDFGATKEANEYKINFEAKDMGDAKIELTYAGFSTSANAAVSDLIAATITTKSATVTLTGDILVTLPDGDWFDGNTSVVEGQPYTFTATKWANYDYPEVTYTMGGGESQVATPDSEGKYTIENVTGDLEISIASEPTGKIYDITVEGDYYISAQLGTPFFGPEFDHETGTGKAQYGKTIWFSVLPRQEADGTNPGYFYGTPVFTMGGEDFTEYTSQVEDDGRVSYVIDGTKITGDITITIPKNEIEAEQFEASVIGTGAGHAVLDKEVVDNGDSVSITVTKNDLYDYTITATEGGETVELVVVDNVYTVEDVHGTVIFTVDITVKIGDAGSEDYITVDETQVWLVTIGSEKLEGQSYAYNGNKMFWSEKYGAYCYLVISTSTPEVSADMFSIVDEDATEIEYNNDVNKTGRVDVNDAQFVYDIYNFEYDEFTSDVTVEKFLRADLNDDRGVDTTDAQVIMSAIMPAVQG